MLDPDLNRSLVLLFAAMVLMAMVLGPCNTVTANVVPAEPPGDGLRGQHLPDPRVRRHQLADPDRLRRRPVRQAVGGRLAARPRLRRRSAPGRSAGTNLTVGMLSVVPVLALGALFFLLGSRHLPADQDRVQTTAAGRGGTGVDGPH